MIYMDHNATTPCDRRVLEEMLPYFTDEFGNPSALYQIGRTARTAVEKAREQVAALLDCSSEEIFFTSGGTEADNWAIKGAVYRGRHIITTSIEHHAVLNACGALEKAGYEVSYLPVDRYGLVDPDRLKNTIRNDTALITIIYANNEIGTLQPVREMAAAARDKGVYFHTDAVQSAGKMPLSVRELGVDMLALSGHKFYGPKGIGVLYIRKGVKISPLLNGGEQERDSRAGTENVPGIVGIGTAAEIAAEEMEEEGKRIKSLRDRLEGKLKEGVPEITVNGHPEKRLYNTLSLCIKDVESRDVLLHLDSEGISVSSGSACASGSHQPSQVLLATGLSEGVARGCIRFSLGRENTEQDVDRVSEVLPVIVTKLRQRSQP
jgi:cysteine desulfurase